MAQAKWRRTPFDDEDSTRGTAEHEIRYANMLLSKQCKSPCIIDCPYVLDPSGLGVGGSRTCDLSCRA